MKAVHVQQKVHKSTGVREHKISKKPQEEKDEMIELFNLLKEIVPTIPHNKKLSKVEILQHVIDYILDLQSALDGHPMVAPVQRLTVPNRTPLGEYQSVENTYKTILENCSLEHTSQHTEKYPLLTRDICESRSVSCWDKHDVHRNNILLLQIPKEWF